MTNATENTVTMHHATRAKMDKLVALLAAEYPALHITPAADEIGKLTHFETTHTTPESDEETEHTVVVLTTKKVPELADIFAACEDANLDPEAGADEPDDKPTSSIVPETYRRMYRENSSTGRSNGDWLAERLAVDCLNADGKLVIEDFTTILEKNGVDMSGKWAQARHNPENGGSGRYRMNGRQVLEKVLAKSGIYIGHDGSEHQPDAEFLADIRTKHAKWLAKEAKRDEATAASIKEAVEGTDAEE
tara:strand:+ start:10176 stop:10919 length:744 start_codon:yes stop_codon:yes gene_type:complete